MADRGGGLCAESRTAFTIYIYTYNHGKILDVDSSFRIIRRKRLTKPRIQIAMLFRYDETHGVWSHVAKQKRPLRVVMYGGVRVT